MPHDAATPVRTGFTRREFLKIGAAGAALAGATAAGCARKPARGPAGPLAMWALTGQLRGDEVLRQLDCFCRAGFGVVLYPRWGLEIEYLGDAWFERVRFIVEQAAGRSMEVWLYDEFTWPSGQAKGLVAAGGERHLAQLLKVAADGRSAVAPLPGTAGLLDISSTRRFIEMTHERYARAIGDFFGTTVRAIFTDEPSLPQQHKGSLAGPDHRWAVPWSEAMDRRLGGGFRDRLAGAKDPADPAIWFEYWAAFADVFESQWVQPIAEWCAAHRIAFSGHLLGEHSCGSAVAFNGSLARQLAHFQIPGIDEIHTRVDPATCEALTLGTISRFPGRERMAEVYALGPPSLSVATLKRMVDLCAVSGVDRFVLAICPHDFRGAVMKREYFGVWGFQQPWFAEAAPVYSEYVREAAAGARRAEPFPIEWPKDEELWAVAGPDPVRSEPLRRRTEALVAAAREVIRQRLSQKEDRAARRAGTTAGGEALPSRWDFAPVGLNSLRIDGTEVRVDVVPADAELSIQRQLVERLSVNGTAVDLAEAREDVHFDASYLRLPAAALLQAGVNRFEVVSPEPKPLRFLPRLILWGSFAVGPDGAVIAPPGNIALGDWRPQGYAQFCGTGVYRATVECARAPRRLTVDSGGYPVRVIWNGRDLGIRCWPPFEFDPGQAARPGANRIEIRVTSTLGHLLTPEDAPPVGLMAARLVAGSRIPDPVGRLCETACGGRAGG